MGRTTRSLLGSIALAAALAAPAIASTVRANPEATGTRIALADDEGETNRLRVGVSPGATEARFRDRTSAIRPRGNRCAEVPGPGSRVDCRLDGPIFFELDIDAGPGDDRVVSAVAERHGVKVSFVRLLGGSGADRLEAGEAEDTIDPGTGNDTVQAGGGYDFIVAGASDDGPDSYDGGAQGATISYAERDAPVRVRLDGAANDGAEGEGDNVLRAFGVTGGSAGERFAGDHHRNYLFGADGPDRLRGHGHSDAIVGEGGSDRIHAGTGDDWVLDRGTAGSDLIDCGPGRDLYEADARDDVVDCEIPLSGPKANRRAKLANAKR
jgi:hypothetical protein